MPPRKPRPTKDQFSFDFLFQQHTDTAITLAESIFDEESTQGGYDDHRTTAAIGISSQAPQAGNDETRAPGEITSYARMEDSGQVGIQFPVEAQGTGGQRGSAPAGEITDATGSGTPDSDRASGGSASGNVGHRDSGARGSQSPVKRGLKPQNYRITVADQLGSGGAKAKFKDNIAAIALCRTLEAENRYPTAEEQQILLRYVGWGGLPQAFDPSNAEWKKEYSELSLLLEGKEYEAARRSTQDAHYTAEGVIRGIFAGLEKIGFQGGRILEPAAGTGHFIGLLPDSMRESTRFTAIELDPTTARIGTHLYPDATHIQRGFQDVVIPTGIFDAVVGNPPFGNQPLFDPNHKEFRGFSIHNYFMAKSLDKLREGGVMAFVVSRYFMDAKSNPARDYIAERAKLLGAIRLPCTAFKQNALTEVTTDVLFFQKLREGEYADTGWTGIGEIFDHETGTTMPVNQYYIDHPQQIIGKMTVRSAMFKESVEVVAAPGTDVYQEMLERFGVLPSAIYSPAIAPSFAGEGNADTPIDENVKVGAYFLTETGQLARRLPDILERKNFEIVTPRNKSAEERIRGMIVIRDTLRQLMASEASEASTDAELNWQRKKLNQQYDRFVAKHGFLSAQPNRLAMSEDPEYPLLFALENNYDRGVSAEVAKKSGISARKPSAEKAAIFTKRVLQPRRVVTQVETSKDALVVSMNERGKVDLPLMMRLTGKADTDIITELHGLIFRNPETSDWETADKYLSGNVKAKLEAAIEANFDDPSYQVNIEALQQVQPADIEPVDIAVQLGSTWVPTEHVAQFVDQLVGCRGSTIRYFPELGKWSTEIFTSDRTLNRVRWGIEEYPATDLIDAILTNRSIQVKREVGTDEHGKKIMEVDEEKTAAANEKADEIRQAFLDWIWEDADRRDKLAKLYNERFNTNVPPKYDGSHLELPGGLLGIEWRPHQKNAVWRGIQEGTLLADHTVGAGKTFVCVAIAMESRRMGLLSKPMLVVPNHLLLQWKDAFYGLYPDAKVLVAEKSDFTKENRERLFARIATGDWDAVIVAHSSFKKIGMPSDTFQDILMEQVNDLSDAIIRIKQENGDRVTIKQMEKARERMQAKMQQKADTGAKDKVVTFAELGVDAIILDEAQEFKNLFINTSLSRISGLGNLEGSDKAFDLFVKCRYLQKQHEGRGVFLATGTPVSNTIAEVYTVQRYMQYDDLKARGLVHFDAWASTFGQIVSGWELDATGVNYKLNSRFAKFQNVPELIAMYRSFADVVSRADLDRQAEERGVRFPVPRIMGGRPRNIIVERHDALARYMGVQRQVIDEQGLPVCRADGTPIRAWNEGSIIHRMENLPQDPRLDNPLKITNDARKAGLDFRLISPDSEDYEGSKVNTAISEIYRIWAKWHDRKGTQMVFCDLSTPKKKGGGTDKSIMDAPAEGEEGDEAESNAISMDDILAGNAAFSVYEDIKGKLIDRGVPEEQIRFIHDAATDAQKAKLFADMNRGEVRILLGSTAKMGAGTNAQRRLVALHHLDAPWRPSDLEQREGRILRQGNLFYEEDPEGFEVEITRYATKQTYDSRMWQTIEYKAAGIEQFRKGDTLQRVIDDVAGEAANAAEMKAAATGNPLILMQVQLQSDLKRLESLRANYQRNLHTLEKRAELLEGADERAKERTENLLVAIQRRDQNTPESFQFRTEKRVYGEDDMESLLTVFQLAMKEKSKDCVMRNLAQSHTMLLGTYRGFEVSLYAMHRRDSHAIQFVIAGDSRYVPDNLFYGQDTKFSITGFFTRLDNFLKGFDSRLDDIERERIAEIEELANVRQELQKPFAQQQKLEDLRQDVREVMTELKLMQADEQYVSSWQPRTGKADMAAPKPLQAIA